MSEVREVLDNIDIDLSGVDLARPIIDNQVILCRTGEVRVEINDAGDKRLVIPLLLEEPATSTTGRPVNVGFQITHSFLISPKGGLTQGRINEELSKFATAVLKVPKVANIGALSQYRGQLVKAKLASRADKNDPDKIYQDVKAWIKA